MFYKVLKPYGFGQEFKSHCSFCTFPLWEGTSIHFFYQCFWSSYLLLSPLFPNVSLWHTVNFFIFYFFWKHLLSEQKNHHWGRDLSVYEHTWKAIFLHIKKPILYVHCREQNRTLWSYVLDFEEHNQSDFTLRNQQWQMLGWVIWKKVVPCYTLHVQQTTILAKY